MAEKNQNIHLFNIQQTYAKTRGEQVFDTNGSALEYIFGKKPVF